MSKRTMTFIITVENSGSQFFYARFRGALRQVVDSFPHLKFVKIQEGVIPDHYALNDPDNAPEDFI